METAPDQSSTLGALAAALAKAQGVMGNPVKNKVNKHLGSKYADLASTLDACREALAANGLAVIQQVKTSGPGVTVITTLLHASGEWVRDHLTLQVEKATAHGVGTAITYARRYALSAMVGLAPDDDEDGNEVKGDASKDTGQKEAPRQQAAKTSRTAEVKEQLAKQAAKPTVWQRLVDLGAMYGKTEEQMASFCKDKLTGKTKAQLSEEDYAHIHDALARTHKPIVGTDTGIRMEPEQTEAPL